MSNDTRPSTLLIWEQIPETTDLFLIPNDDIERNGWRKRLEEAHGLFLNSDESNEGLDFLNLAVLDEDSRYVESKEHLNQYMCLFNKYKQNTIRPLTNVEITHVYRSGFML